MTGKTLDVLRQLPIWLRVEAEVSHEQIGRVERLVEIASGRLLQIRDTFPTYTIHDREHANNVVRLMGELLAGRTDQLTGLEAAMLILSAYFHDAGMAFSPEERLQLRSEEDFPRFLKDHPAALVTLEKTQSDELPVDIAEWYCRWRHAERVFKVLNDVRKADPTLLEWNSQDIGETLGHLCRSHNLGASELKNDNLFPTDFRYECDVRFCAVLLRLADILDFDRSRSPEQVYRDLGLERRSTQRDKTSDLEWRKHLASEGFVFPGQRDPEYQLGFRAGPDLPAVEYDIRQFLDVIEDELVKSASVLRSCSERWREHPLPARIDRRYILGKGYTYGEHRFVLDQREVLHLLMGEKLYEVPYVFVRETLQNALDTSRHRVFHERFSSGNIAFQCEPIRVTDWVDGAGYRWIRIEDFGMGMTEQIIQDFLLKVGRSYYNSTQFEADVIRYAKTAGQHFRPISRFGIGLLSCFIVGDRIEIATRHAVEPDGPIRLSLSGVQDFFILQKRPNPFRPMPAPGGEEPGERRSPGTTVCIRLDPRKESGAMDLAMELKRHLLCPPVPVSHDGELLGGDPRELLDQPWCQLTTIALTEEDTEQISTLFGRRFQRPLEIRLIPVDLTRHSPTDYVKGQLLLVALVESEELFDALQTKEVEWDSDIQQEQKGINVTFSMTGDGSLEAVVEARFSPEHKRVRPTEGSSISAIVDLRRYLSVPETSLRDILVRARDIEKLEYLAALGHNGISLPLLKRSYETVSHLNTDTFVRTRSGQSWGLIMFQDELRPEVSVSRDRLVHFPWKLWSACTLAVRRALAAVVPEDQIEPIDILSYDDEQRIPPIVLGDLLDDKWLTREDMWPREKLFGDGLSQLSVGDLLASPSLAVSLRLPEWTDMAKSLYEVLRAFLARYWLETFVRYGGRYNAELIIRGGESTAINEAEKLFPPLFFAKYDGPHGGVLRVSDKMPHRIDHPFSQWLMKHATALSQDFAGLFGQIRDALMASRWSFEAGYLPLEERVRRINDSLRRAGELKPEMKPSKKVFLTAQDFGES